MARIRSAKPEWWTSAKWCRLPRDVRSTYKGIWEVMCDDDGRFLADPRQVKADVWPLDDDITPKEIAAWLPQLADVQVTRGDGTKSPAIVFYETDGVRYGFLPGFVKHQKISHPTPSKLPKPLFADGDRNDSETTMKNSGASPESISHEVEEDVDVDFDIDIEKEVEGKTTTALGRFSGKGRTYVEQLLAAVPAPEAWGAEIEAMRAGIPGHCAATPDQIETAAHDLLANGKTAHPSLRQFRRYVEGAKPDSTTGRARGTPMERSIANTKIALGTK